MAPVRLAAQKAMTHSGRLRMMMATRSPCSTPKVVLQPVGQGAGDAVVLGEGGALVLVDEERLVAVGERHIEHGAQVGWRVLPRAGGDAADVALFHLEDLARRGQSWRWPRRWTCWARRSALGTLLLGCGRGGGVGRGGRGRGRAGVAWRRRAPLVKKASR